MALGYLLSPSFQIENLSGKPLVGGTIKVFRHGTTTPYITYKDFTGDLNPAEVPLNNKGMAVILADTNLIYDVYCYDANGVEQWSRLNVTTGTGGDGDGRLYNITSTDDSITTTTSTDVQTGVTTFDLAVTNPARDYTTRGSWDRSLQIDNTAHTISGDMQCVAIRQQINNDPSTCKYAKVCEADINTITWINEWATSLQLSFQSSGAYYKGKSAGIFSLNMENYVTHSGYHQEHEEDGKWLLWDGDNKSPGLVKLRLYWRDDSSSQHYELWAETSNLKYFETIVAQALLNCSMRNHLTSSLPIEQERNIWRFSNNGIESLKPSLPTGMQLVGSWEPSSASIQPVEDEGPGVFYVEYGTTTFADAEAAYLAGKTLICREIGTTVQQTRMDDLYFLIDYMPTAGTYTGHFVFSNITGYIQTNAVLTPSATYKKFQTVMATRYQVLATLNAEIAPEWSDLSMQHYTEHDWPIPAGTVVTQIDNTSSDTLQWVYRSKVAIEQNEAATSGPLQDPTKWDKVHISDILGSNVFYAEICVTPFADIKAAYDRGDVIMGKSGSDVYPLYSSSLGTSYSDTFSFASLHGNVWYLWTCYQNSTGYEATNGWATPPGMVLFPERANIADGYSNQRTYAVGDLCYNGNLYRCTTAIDSPENWTAAHWTQTSLNAELARFATVSRTGDYNDLINKPTIPAAQVQSDWNQTDTTAVDYIKNKPDVDDVVFVNYGTGTLTQIGTAVSAGKTVIAGRDTGSRIYYAVLTQYGYGVYYFTCIDENSVQTWSISPDGGDGTWAASSVSIPAAQIQSDWNQTDNTARDFIKNKPANLVQDANYVHTDNNFTNNDVTKLSGVETGAQVNVQANWNETDTTSDSYIQNKPTIPAAQVNSDWNASSGVAEILNKPANLVQDANYVHTDNNFTTSLKDKLDGIATGAEVNVQADWTESDSSSDAYIQNKPTLATVATTGAYSDLSGTPSLATVATTGDYDDLTNKPTIPAAQVNSDWNASSGVAEILNKPSLATVATTGAYSDLSGTPNLATVATSGDYDDLTNKPTIPAAQVNSDWNASSGVAQILNKPTLATVATTGNYSDLNGAPSLATVATSGDYDDLTNKPTIPAAQVNSDWNASTGVAQILNKPSLATVATTGNYSDLNGAPSLATVATTGDYDDLSNKPTIPAAQVNADWNATSGVAEILNKPTIPVVPSMKNLVAGSNITITDSANSVTIAATVPVIGTITV